MFKDNKIILGMVDGKEIMLYPKMANRHGMIAGATGTGKTTTVRVLAESFSAAGVPVFLSDVKGDLSGLSSVCPVTFWDIYGEKGLPLRTTVTEMGPLLLSRIMGLTEIQTDVLTVVFKIADDEGLLLIDTKDLKAMLSYVGDNAKEYSLKYGNMSKQSLAAIIRAIVALESEGGEQFFGEPALSIGDWFGTDCNGKGNMQILDCQKLITSPTMYATFMLWLVSELFESLPEVGDREKPKMVFFFDEAHLLFNSAPKALIDKLEQVVKLIRSKGVGIYFITQLPKDIPDGVLSQLGNKIQHAIHAYTPTEQKAAKAAAMSYRVNPNFDTYEALTTMGIGEALISVLDEEGVPTVVQRCKINKLDMDVEAITDLQRDSIMKDSLLFTKYTNYFDRDSAYEFLERRNISVAAEVQEPDVKTQKRFSEATEREAKKAVKTTARSAAGTVGRELGNSIGKSIGGQFGKKLGGNVGASIGRGILNTLFKL